MARYECVGHSQASGLGSEKEAYKKLLLHICKSGVVLTHIRITSGLVSTLVDYTVEGTEDELAIFRQLVEGK
jgi:hypothetical protein